MMTKKDFEGLADAVRRGLQGAGDPVKLLADFCAGQNPKFDRARWLNYLTTGVSRPGKNTPGFTLEIETDNVAFAGADKGPELARILRHVAGIVEQDGRAADRRRVLDINGNSVGKWEVR